jgi:hypothetical protein
MIDYHHSITNPQPLLRILDELYDQSITIITINPDVNITCQLKIYGCLDKCYLNYLNCRYPDTIIELPSSLGRFGSELVNLKSKQPEQTHRFTLGDSNLYVISGHQSLLSLFYSLPAVEKVSDTVS